MRGPVHLRAVVLLPSFPATTRFGLRRMPATKTRSEILPLTREPAVPELP